MLAGVWGLAEVLLMLLKRSAPAASHDRHSIWLLWLAIVVGIIGAMWAGHELPGLAMPGREGILLAAFVIFILGMIIRVYAIAYLGKFFTTNVAIADDHKLIDSGPYKYVRHPSYTGVLLLFLSFGLFYTNWLSLIIMVVPIYAAFLWRIIVEEEALLGAFGDEYSQYIRRTKRLVPFLY